MERILISRPSWFMKLGSLFMLCLLAILAYVLVKGNLGPLTWSFDSVKFIVCVILLFGTGILTAIWRLSFVHPLYFDERCILWGKPEKENVVAFFGVEGILAYAGRERSSIRIKYRTCESVITKIWFVLSVDGKDTFGKLRELEHWIQKQKPDFKILDKGWIKSSNS